MQLSQSTTISQNKLNLGLIDYMINDIKKVVSLEVYLKDRAPFNHLQNLMISNTALFISQSILSGVNIFNCQFVAYRGFIKG